MEPVEQSPQWKQTEIKTEVIQTLQKLERRNGEAKKILGEMKKDGVDFACFTNQVAIDEAVERRLRSVSLRMKELEESGALEERFCQSCGEKIPQERLLAIPYTVYCVKCKLIREGSTA
jgi:RNA polymerase-binding transcription factor DksA